MFGINGSEFLILGVIAVMVLGPTRLPEYAAQFGRLVRELRKMATGAREQLREEVGPEFDDLDWQKLDPRQYDPRRIVREALVEEDAAIRESKRRERSTLEPSEAAPSTGTAESAEAAPRERSPIERFQAQVDLRDRSAAAPFDSEAT